MEQTLHRRWIIFILLFLGFFLDGSLSLVFSTSLFAGALQVAPQLLLMAVVLTTFMDPDEPFMFWTMLVLGLFYDLFYTGVIGQYTVILPIAYLLTRYLLSYFEPKFIYRLADFVLVVLIAQVILYALTLLFTIQEQSLFSFLGNVLAPTILFNIILFAIFYWPSQKLLDLMNRGN